MPIELVEPSAIGAPPNVEETGETFRENALLKARAYAAWSGLPSLADDGGLEIDALGGEPGVRSRRWIGGRDASDAELIEYTLERMRGLSQPRRRAGMRVATALVTPDGTEVAGEGTIRGLIATRASARVDPGFPFRSLFVVRNLRKLYVDLTEAEHELVNHRRTALAPIRAALVRDKADPRG